MSLLLTASSIVSDSLYVFLPLMIALIFFTNIKKTKKARGLKSAILAAVILAISAAVATALKILIPEARPLAAVGAALDSFPSRHAQLAFTAAALGSWIHAGKRAKYVEALFYIWATAISISRIALGMHFWWDVLAGAAIGWAIGFVMTRWLGK